MNLDGANDAEPSAANGVAEAATTFEARIPVKKDATLREFLGKMDEYAPIVSKPRRESIHLLTCASDTGRRDKLLPHTRWPTASTTDIPSPCASPCSRDAEVHRRHRRRRLPVLPHPVLQYYKQQPYGRNGSWRTTWSSSTRRRARRKRFWSQGQGLQPWCPAPWLRGRWPGRQPRPDSADYGGPRYGCRRVRCQYQTRRVLPVRPWSTAHQDARHGDLACT
jgi:hypothetical protein